MAIRSSLLIAIHLDLLSYYISMTASGVVTGYFVAPKTLATLSCQLTLPNISLGGGALASETRFSLFGVTHCYELRAGALKDAPTERSQFGVWRVLRRSAVRVLRASGTLGMKVSQNGMGSVLVNIGALFQNGALRRSILQCSNVLQLRCQSKLLLKFLLVTSYASCGLLDGK